MATGKATTKGSSAKKGGAKQAATKQGGAKQGSVKKGGAKSAKAPAPGAGKCTGWEAFEDQMPPSPPTLRVSGKCRFPTHGYKVRLKKAVPQGINPAILLLEKIVTPPTGPVIQTPETVDVRYQQRVKKGQYKQVTILPDGKTIRVKIIT
ncbi:MAG TPA: hypothetical protein VJZ91_00755 [Blastocatellia bacterium]|nr:hypothetical protein [Blastocatellia bacterium]